MKFSIHLIINDINLFNIFQNSSLFSKVTIGSKLDTDEHDVLIISDRVVDSNELLEAADKNTLKAKYTLYLTSNGYSTAQINALKVRLLAKKIVTIPPKLTEKQILDRVCQEINVDVKVNKNVISFFGADSKVGTTVTALAVGECLSENTSCSVAFLNLQGNVSFDYLDGKVEGLGLDAIKTKIFNEILSEQELQAAMIQRGKLFILPPVHTITDLRYYHPRHVEYLIELASGMFDVVICDAGYNPNSGLYIGALNATTNRYLVATQQESCKRAFDVTKEQLLDTLEISPDSFYLVINRYLGLLDTNGTYKLAEQNYHMTHAVTLPNVSGVFWQAEIDKKTLRNYKNTEYNYNLNELVKMISVQLGFEYQGAALKKKNFLSMIFGGEG